MLQAIDPENDPVSYSIVSGNDLRQFAIGDKSGVITVIRKLDREDLTRYQLVSRYRRGRFSPNTVAQTSYNLRYKPMHFSLYVAFYIDCFHLNWKKNILARASARTAP